MKEKDEKDFEEHLLESSVTNESDPIYEGIMFGVKPKETGEKARHSQIEEALKAREESLSDVLNEFLIKRDPDAKDSEIYNSVSMNRDLFCKLKNDKDYYTSKNTVLKLAIALKLNIEETERLLHSAGYTLSNGVKADIIVRYFIEHGIYDCITIDNALQEFGLHPCFHHLSEE